MKAKKEPKPPHPTFRPPPVWHPDAVLTKRDAIKSYEARQAMRAGQESKS